MKCPLKPIVVTTAKTNAGITTSTIATTAFSDCITDNCMAWTYKKCSLCNKL